MARRLDEEPYLPEVETPEVAPGGRRDPWRKPGKERRFLLRYLADLGLILALAVLVLSRNMVLESQNYRLDRINQALTFARAQNQLLSAELARQESTANLLSSRAAARLAPAEVVVLPATAVRGGLWGKGA